MISATTFHGGSRRITEYVIERARVTTAATFARTPIARCSRHEWIIGPKRSCSLIQVARKKRGNDACRFDVVAAESLPYEDGAFDAVVSSLFFHHVDLELKQRTLAESFRVLPPGGKLVIADMHLPTTWMGWLVSWTSRWFFMQPQIGENIRGVMPSVIESAGFKPPDPE